MKALLCDYQEIISNLKGNQYFGRFGKTFSTNNAKYFYDTGTGKVLQVNDDVHKLLSYLLEHDGEFDDINTLKMSRDEFEKAFSEILSSIESENILSIPEYSGMIGYSRETLDKEYKKVGNLTLELTEDCNLRCKYCIYNPSHANFREFTKKKMTFETAKKAIDIFNDHTGYDEELYIGFYGGEPLMNYKLLKQCVEYAEESMRDKKINFSMTTNATLITKRVSEFLIDHPFQITISLDGPEEVHDRNRIFINNKGSYQATMRGIKNLVEVSQEKGVRPPIGFNMVNAGPNIEENYELMQQLIDSTDWLPPNPPATTTTVDNGPTKIEYVLPQSQEEREILYDTYDPLLKWTRDEKESKEKKLFSDGSLNQGLLNVHNRIIQNDPVDTCGMNGCCLPGQRRIYVATDGKFYPCEKVGNTYPIGNVDDGFDMEGIHQKYIEDYVDESNKVCKNCWAINMCGLCYVNCYDDKGANFDFRHDSCVSERQFIENNLSYYHELLEKDSESLEYLNEMEML